jgi:hypothetical protein
VDHTVKCFLVKKAIKQGVIPYIAMGEAVSHPMIITKIFEIPSIPGIGQNPDSEFASA